jgi:membrane associated rhomboid family serine protease
MEKFKKSISNYLIALSIFITILSVPFPELLNYGMNSYNLSITGNYLLLSLQFLLYQFLHWSILHILGNSIFIYIFWNQVEKLLWTKKYIIFFILNTIFTWAALLFLSSWNTIWISWFAMAVLGYMFMELRRINHPDYRWAGTFLVINILIWFTSNISLIWHLAGAIFGILYFYMLNSSRNKLK